MRLLKIILVPILAIFLLSCSKQDDCRCRDYTFSNDQEIRLYGCSDEIEFRDGPLDENSEEYTRCN